jgi:hypothetical protein
VGGPLRPGHLRSGGDQQGDAADHGDRHQGGRRPDPPPGAPGRAEHGGDADAAKQKDERLVGRVNNAFQLMSFGMLPLGRRLAARSVARSALGSVACQRRGGAGDEGRGRAGGAARAIQAASTAAASPGRGGGGGV